MASCYVDPHNYTVLTTLQIGDLVEFPRPLYSHWGVYIGNQQIVHLDAIDNTATTSGSLFSICGVNFAKACVKIDDFFKVAQGCKAKRNNDKDAKCNPLSPDVIVERAMKMVGEIGYNLIWNNCEHLAAYLRYGKRWSEQVNTVAAAAVGLGAATIITGIVAGIIYGIVDGHGKKK